MKIETLSMDKLWVDSGTLKPQINLEWWFFINLGVNMDASMTKTLNTLNFEMKITD